MKALWATALCVTLVNAAAAEPQLAKLAPDSTSARWSLKEFNADLPSDWSDYEFLTIEFRSSTAQRFEFRIFTTGGVRKVRLQPFSGAWIRAALPLVYFQKRDQQG